MQLEAIPQSRLKTQQSTQKTALTALQALNTDLVSLATKAEALAKPATLADPEGHHQQHRRHRHPRHRPVGHHASTSRSTRWPRPPARLRDTRRADRHVVAGGTRQADHSRRHRARPRHRRRHPRRRGRRASTPPPRRPASPRPPYASTTAATGCSSSPTTTGADTDFTLTDGDGTDLLGGAAVRAGADAPISLGLGITATSSTNTFTDLVPGVEPHAQQLGRRSAARPRSPSPRTRSTAQASVKALVDQLNALLTTIDTQTAYGTGTTAKGVLAGDAAARGVRDQLLSTVFGTGTTSMAGVGIQTDRYGKLVLRRGGVRQGVRRRPGRRRRPVHPRDRPGHAGWAARLQDVAKAASDPVNGTITSADHRPPVDHRPARRRHRRLGHPPGAAAHLADPAVHRARDRALHPAEPGQLAGRPDLLPQLLLVVTTEGNR